MVGILSGGPGGGCTMTGGMSRPSSFQRLALWTTAVTYLLILVGGLVRASGAGLGCPDWPRCFGSWIPPASAAELPPGFEPSQFNATLMWTEYLNRLLGVSVGLFILAATVSAWRHHRHEPRVLWPTVAALLLTGFEGWLGGRVVAAELAPWIVTAHLIVALVIVSLLLYATFHAFVGSTPADVSPARRTLGVATYVAMALMLVQVGLGTFVRGRVDEWLDRVPRPDALANVGAIDLAHRNGAVLMLGVIVLLWFRTWLAHRHEPLLMRAASAMLALTVAQLVVGAVLAFAGLPQAAQVAHLSLASLLLGAMMLLALLAHRWPERAPE
jgi:cytochrome c oxidase assembly protein subunit 15